MSLHFLNSRIFPSSHSTADLHDLSQNIYQTYNYGYAVTEPSLQFRNPTQISLLDRPDDSITALPPQSSPRDAQDPQGQKDHASGPAPENKKQSKWIRIKASAKAQWNRIAKKRHNFGKSTGGKHDMVIGYPTDFKRVGGTELLVKPRPKSEGHRQEDEWDVIQE